MGNLYERIIGLCEEKGIKGGKMCTDIGISKGTLTDLKMGRQSGISTTNAQKIASYFGVSVAYLMGWEEEQKKNDIQADIILKMRTDSTFLSVVENLYKLDKDKLETINQMLNTLFK